MRIFLFIFILVLLNTGCEKQAFISYRVINHSTKNIKIIFFNTNDFDGATYNKIDSVFIDVNTEKLVVIQGKGLNRVSEYKETSTYLNEFKYFDIYQQNIKSKTDFLFTSKWNYVEENKHTASYTATVNESDF